MQQIATPVREPLEVIYATPLRRQFWPKVCSLYPDREQPKALIPEGTLALGRELCKDYGGWDAVTPCYSGR